MNIVYFDVYFFIRKKDFLIKEFVKRSKCSVLGKNCFKTTQVSRRATVYDKIVPHFPSCLSFGSLKKIARHSSLDLKLHL